MAVEQPELSIPSPIGRKLSEVESPPHSVSGVERSVYRKGWEQAIQSEFEGHMKTRTFSMVNRLPEGRKPVGSKWCFDYKADKEGKITKFKSRLVVKGSRRSVKWIAPTHLPPVRHQYLLSLCSQ